MNSLRSVSVALGRSLRFISTNTLFSPKITILGASGGIGQPLALLMKQSLIASEVALYDVVNVAGVAADLSHIDTRPKVNSYTGSDELEAALSGTALVLIPAGVPRKPGMTLDDLFQTNASIVAHLSSACGKHCPEAMICIITDPVNSTVPIAAEMLKKEGAYNPSRLFGVTTLDVMRSKLFIAKAMGLDASKVVCPVIGGHSGNTVIPVISQCIPTVNFCPEEHEKLVSDVQSAGTEVVVAKSGAGSATLSMAYAGAHFASSLLHAMRGQQNIVECAFVASNITDAEFFASPVLLGPDGVAKVMDIGNLTNFEANLLTMALPKIQNNIQKGKLFAQSYRSTRDP